MTRLLIFLVFLTTLINAQDTTTDPPKPNFHNSLKPIPNFPGDVPLQFFFKQLFNNFFRPVRVTGKTFHPSVVAIVGDKPYISLEVFNKFSPFKWLMSAFQGKIQSLCGFLTPPSQDNPDETSTATVLDPATLQQLLHDIQKPDVEPVYNSGPVKVFDFPSPFKSRKS